MDREERRRLFHDAPFPASEVELAEHARRQGASATLVDRIASLSGRTFESLEGLEDALKRHGEETGSPATPPALDEDPPVRKS